MKYTIEQKKEVVNEYLNGEKCKYLIEKYKICKATLYLWINLFKVRKKRSDGIASVHLPHSTEISERHIFRTVRFGEKWKRLEISLKSLDWWPQADSNRWLHRERVMS